MDYGSQPVQYQLDVAVQAAEGISTCDGPMTGKADCTGQIATKPPGTPVGDGASIRPP